MPKKLRAEGRSGRLRGVSGLLRGETGVSIRMLTRADLAESQCLRASIQVSIHPALVMPKKLRGGGADNGWGVSSAACCW